MQIVQETLARGFSTTLASALRAAINVSIREIDQRPYDEYIREIPNPTLLTTLSLDPLEGAALLQIPLRSAFTATELMLGGSGSPEQPNRAMTDLELGLMRSVIEAALPEIRYAFEPIVLIDPHIVSQESNPQFAQLAAPTDMVIVIAFDIKIESEVEVMTLCIPFSSLQARLEELSAHDRLGNQLEEKRAREQALLVEHVVESTVSLSANFRSAVATSHQITAMQVGDVLLLNHPVELPLTLTVDGIATHDVRIGRVNRHYAIEILDHVDPGRHRRPAVLQVAGRDLLAS